MPRACYSDASIWCRGHACARVDLSPSRRFSLRSPGQLLTRPRRRVVQRQNRQSGRRPPPGRHRRSDGLRQRGPRRKFGRKSGRRSVPLGGSPGSQHRQAGFRRCRGPPRRPPGRNCRVLVSADNGQERQRPPGRVRQRPLVPVQRQRRGQAGGSPRCRVPEHCRLRAVRRGTEHSAIGHPERCRGRTPARRRRAALSVRSADRARRARRPCRRERNRASPRRERVRPGVRR